MRLRIFGREPVVILNALSAILGLVVTLGVTGLTQDQAGAIVGVISAILGVIAAALTRPVAPQAFTTLVAAGVSFVATFGYDVPQATVGALNVAVLAVLTLLTRGQVTPAPAAQPSGPKSA